MHPRNQPSGLAATFLPNPDEAATPMPDTPEMKTDSLSEADLHDAITRALLGGRLRAGTPLRERYLSEAFGVTRGLVRKVLLSLGQEGKLVMHANRGAFVPEPTQQQIQAVYQARRAVESGLVGLLAQTITTEQIHRLHQHIQEEREASHLAKRSVSVVLAGDFHLLLADMMGNPELLSIVKRLVSRTQMFVALFEPAQASDFAPDEHEPIVHALAKGQSAAAATAMAAHLSLVEHRVLQRSDTLTSVPVADILRSMLNSKT